MLAALPCGDAVGEAAVAGTIGHACHRWVAAEAEILRARCRDRPTAPFLAELEQRAAMAVMDRLLLCGRQWHHSQRPLQLRTQLRCGFATMARRRDLGLVFRNKRLVAGLVARQIEAGELADHGIAADPDLGCDFT